MDNLCWKKIIVVNFYLWYLLARKQLTIFCYCMVYSGVWNSVFRGFDCCWSSLWQSPIYTGCGSLQLGPLRFNASFLFCYYLGHLEWRNQRFFEGQAFSIEDIYTSRFQCYLLVLYPSRVSWVLGSYLSWVLRLLIDSIFHNWREFAKYSSTDGSFLLVVFLFWVWLQSLFFFMCQIVSEWHKKLGQFDLFWEPKCVDFYVHREWYSPFPIWVNQTCSFMVFLWLLLLVSHKGMQRLKAFFFFYQSETKTSQLRCYKMGGLDLFLSYK